MGSHKGIELHLSVIRKDILMYLAGSGLSQRHSEVVNIFYNLGLGKQTTLCESEGDVFQVRVSFPSKPHFVGQDVIAPITAAPLDESNLKDESCR